MKSEESGSLHFSWVCLFPGLRREGSQCCHRGLSSVSISCACTARGMKGRSCRSTCIGGLGLGRHSCFSSWSWSCCRHPSRLLPGCPGSSPLRPGYRPNAQDLVVGAGIADSSGIVVASLPLERASFLAGHTAASSMGSLASVTGCSS